MYFFQINSKNICLNYTFYLQWHVMHYMRGGCPPSLSPSDKTAASTCQSSSEIWALDYLAHTVVTAFQNKSGWRPQSITCSRFPERDSMRRTFLSLQVVARRLPSVLKDMERTTSVWWLMVRTGFFITCSGQSRFQIITCTCQGT